MLFKNKKILITGGTGSLGKELTRRLLNENVDTIRIFSRDEWKQIEMEKEFANDKLRFFIGDVRDKERLLLAVQNVDIVIHTAALKQVPTAEYNPFEAIKTNVIGSQNLIECCLVHNVDKILAIGTDKAVSPLNTYGASKMLMERLFISANNYKGNKRSKFFCVRYGNVLGSRGSLLPVLLSQIKQNSALTITSPEMTRFSITMNEAIDLIFRAFNKTNGGEIFVPRIKAYRVQDIKDAIVNLTGYKNKEKRIPVRQGEKFHEMLINSEELRNTFENETDYVIIDNINQKSLQKENLKVTLLKNDYKSNTVELYSVSELEKVISENIPIN